MPKVNNESKTETPPDQKPPAAKTATWFVPIENTTDFYNVLFYGREGSGKTTDAVAMANIWRGEPADKHKVLVINAEGGLRKQALRNRGIDISRVVMWPDPEHLVPITRPALDEVFQRVKADLEADPESWGGVVFDSATEIHTALLEFAQQKRVSQVQRRGVEVDPDFIDRADYGTMSKLFRDVLRKFRDLPCYFAVTALERRDVDEDTGKPQYGPAVTPGIQNDLLGYMDMVVMTKSEDEDGPFRALTRSNSRYRAKDRFDILPRVLVNPTFDRIDAYVKGTLTEEKDQAQRLLSQRAASAQDATVPSVALDDDADNDNPTK